MQFSNKQLSKLRSRIRNSPFRRILQHIRHRGIRDSDVFLASYPKSGNTWVRHLLTNVITGKSTEWRGELSKISVMVGRHQNLLEVLPSSGRLIKTHEPFRKDYQRAIFILRDGRDVAVSEYHYQKQYSPAFVEYNDDFNIFFDRFLEGTVNGYGAWHKHTLSWLNSSTNQSGNLLLVKFEELKQDPLGKLQQMVDFLGLQADPSQLQAAVEDTSVEAMKKKESDYWEKQGTNNPHFVRRAKSGNWHEMISDKNLSKFNSIAGEAMNAAGYQI